MTFDKKSIEVEIVEHDQCYRASLQCRAILEKMPG